MEDKFTAADKVVHSVESQWHYPILTKHGFEPLTKQATGFVRAYEYRHPDGRCIRCNTGISSDYWTDTANNRTGYWSELERYIAR